MFLTETELESLTGYSPRRPDKQAQWLRERGYPFDLSAQGRPRVLRSYVEQRLGGKVERSREPQLRLP